MDEQPWIISLIRTYHCTACRRQVPTRALQATGVGLVEEPSTEPFPVPYAQMQVVCEHCGTKALLQLPVSLNHILDAVRYVFHHGPRLRQPDAFDPLSQRGVKAIGEIDEAELRTIKAKLKRMSFNRNTKSFQHWIQRLDTNLEDPP